MADNVAITAGSGTSIASDDIGGVQYQRTKLSLGADGSAVDAVAGAGAVGTGVQRVTLASDDPAVTDLDSINTKTPALGQAVAAGSVPVVLPADQITTLTPPAAITGFATSVHQVTLINSLSSIDGHVDGVEGSLTSIDAKMTACNTGAVVIASSALPTGAATAARQDTGNNSLSSIDGKIVACNTGAVVLAAGTAAVGKLAANTGVTIGAVEIAASQTLATVTTVGAVTAITNALPAGTNAIGKLAANSGVDIGDVDVTTMPARVATTDTITAKLATDAIQNGVTALTPKFAAIAASSSGDNTLVAAVSGKKIRVLSYTLVAAAAVTCRFEDGAGGTAKSGVMSFGANGGVTVPFSSVGHFETTANTLLNLELSGAVSVAGHICYVEV